MIGLNYIKEARRCLAKNGYLMIAQTSRELNEGERLHSLRDIIRKEGFEIYSEEQRGDFTFIEARIRLEKSVLNDETICSQLTS